MFKFVPYLILQQYPILIYVLPVPCPLSSQSRDVTSLSSHHGPSLINLLLYFIIILYYIIIIIYSRPLPSPINDLY